MSYMKERDLDLKDYIELNGKWYCVSTVTLVVEHPGGMWYETMIFGSDGKAITDYSDRYCERYKTKREAQEGHKKVINGVSAGEIKLSNPFEAFMEAEGFDEDARRFFTKGISKSK